MERQDYRFGQPRWRSLSPVYPLLCTLDDPRDLDFGTVLFVKSLSARKFQFGQHRGVAKWGKHWVGDVADPTTADCAIAATRLFGRLDVLVNNAGIDFTSDLLQTEADDVRKVFGVNFFGAFLMLTAAARAMNDGGSIINVISRTASVGVPTMTVYGASKGALLSLTRGAAIDLAPLGIRVNAVAPGLTATPLAEAWIADQPEPDRFRQHIESSIPQGRLGRPGDVAAAILYLASDAAAHVTGISLAVDGGYTAA